MISNCLICGAPNAVLSVDKKCLDKMIMGILPEKLDRCPICARREVCNRGPCRFSADLFMLRMKAAEAE